MSFLIRSLHLWSISNLGWTVSKLPLGFIYKIAFSFTIEMMIEPLSTFLIFCVFSFNLGRTIGLLSELLCNAIYGSSRWKTYSLWYNSGEEVVKRINVFEIVYEVQSADINFSSRYKFPFYVYPNALFLPWYLIILKEMHSFGNIPKGKVSDSACLYK